MRAPSIQGQLDATSDGLGGWATMKPDQRHPAAVFAPAST
jgi:hypothetical protein